MLDTTAFNKALKIHYAKSLSRVLMDDPMATPFMKLTARKQGKTVKSAFGQSFVVAMKLRDQQTANSQFDKSQGKSDGSYGQSAYENFIVPAVVGYATAKVSGVTALLSEGDENSFVDALAEEIDGALRQAQGELAKHAFRTGTGSRGQIGAITATTIQLKSKADIVNFNKDMILVAAAADGTGAAKATGPTVRVTGVDFDTYTLTVSADMTGGGGPWAINDYLFLDGDFQSGTKTKIYGVAGWNPVTKPTGGDSWCGVDRSTDFRLYGLRHDATTSSDLLNALIDASATVSLAGGKTTHAFCNPLDYAKVCALIEDKKTVHVENKEYGISVDGVEIIGQAGAFPLIPDRTVQQGRIHMVNLDNFYWVYAGPDLVHPCNEDGNTVRYRDAADALEARVRSVANLVCEDPSQNCVIYNIA